MVRLILLTVVAVFVCPAFSQFQIQPIQRACDLRTCQCPQSYQPFCGTDQITYNNKCSLECAQRQCNSNVRVKFEGVCAERYVHDEGQGVESRKNFVVIRPPVNYRPESPTNSFERYPATIPTPTTRRISTRYYGTTPKPTSDYFQYGTTQRPTTNYFQYGTTQRPTTNYFQYEPTKKSTPNYFQYSTSTRRPTNYFEYSTPRRQGSNSFEYNTTPRPYYGSGGNNNILSNTGNGEGNDQRNNNQYNQNQVPGTQYGDFYDY